MRIAIIAIASLFSFAVTAAETCDRVFLSDDRSVVVAEIDGGLIMNGHEYGLRGCGSGLVCATDRSTGEFIPHFLSVEAPGAPDSAALVAYRHPERGEIILTPYCITPQLPE
jgi:hypothetical protein